MLLHRASRLLRTAPCFTSPGRRALAPPSAERAASTRARAAMRAACLCVLATQVSAFHAVSPAARAVPTRLRHLAPMLSESPSPDDDSLAAALRARREELERERSSLEQEEASALDQRTEPEPTSIEPLGPTVPPYAPDSGGPVDVEADPAVAPRADGPATTAAGAGPGPPASGGFRFEEPSDRKYVAGLDTSPDSNDTKLLRLATIYGGRLLTAITVSSLVFYVYVGLSGGITDGFDRYTEPIEDIRVTMEREGTTFR